MTCAVLLHMLKILKYFVVALVIGTLTACAQPNSLSDEDAMATALVLVAAEATPTPLPSPTPLPPHVLTVCMGQEPASLFLYADTSAAARSVLQAVYDGPFDTQVTGEITPVILERIPSFENGNAELRPVEVRPGEVIVGALGNWVSLQEGVNYRPSGCTSPDCAQTFAGGDESILMDELVVRFRLKPDLLWSDGMPLTASDSVYSYTVAKALYGNTLDVLRYTASYTPLDEHTVEWVAAPGYQGIYAANFFSPLPHHQLSAMPVEELLTAEISARIPLGWGPYTVAEWIPGDHITLDRNANYFRAAEGLPFFDHVVFRFVASGDAAINALLVGECDLVDQTALTYAQIPQLSEAQMQLQAKVTYQISTSWEQAAFGIDSLDESHLDFFERKEFRQALTMCIDRQGLVDELLLGWSSVPNGYLPVEHVSYAPEAAHYDFDPAAARALLAAEGWVDDDQNVATPLTAVGIPGIADGTPLAFTYIVPADSEREAAANYVKESLSQCGIALDVQVQPWDQFLSPGPDGDLFGRNFEMAQFAWAESQIPACFLYLSEEIPGPYPDYDKGWGGGNVAGYSNPEFDRACQAALHTLPGTPENLQAHQQALRIFSEDLPAIPLYWRSKIMAMRPDLCAPVADGRPHVNLSMIEMLDYGENCSE